MLMKDATYGAQCPYHAISIMYNTAYLQLYLDLDCCNYAICSKAKTALADVSKRIFSRQNSKASRF